MGLISWSLGECVGYIESKLLLQRSKKPTAIFTLGNLNAFGAMRAIVEEGLTIPDNISLISFDDYVHSAFLATPLTAVGQQMEAIGQFAVKLLYNQLDSASTAKSKGISLATQFNERASVKNLTPNQ